MDKSETVTTKPVQISRRLSDELIFFLGGGYIQGTNGLVVNHNRAKDFQRRLRESDDAA